MSPCINFASWNLETSMSIPLTPGQGVSIHGFVRARRSLTWGDVLASERLTFQYLNASCNLSDQDLYRLQPDVGAWKKAKKITLQDCARMRACWSAHPIRDFQADLADVINMKWTAQDLKDLGVTYDDLVSVGLTVDTMPLMGLTLHGWAQIGFTKAHASAIPALLLSRVFKMHWFTVIASLPS